jgi:MFS family permease
MMPSKRWLQIASICGLGVVANMCTGEIGPLVPELESGLRATAQGVGVAAGMQFLPFLLGGTFVGKAIERTSSRRVVILGLLLLGFVDVSNLFATTLAWFVINTFVQGVGILSVLVAAQVAIAGKFTGTAQVPALAAWSTVTVIGNAAGMLLSSGLSTPSMWRATYLAHALLLAVLGILGVLSLSIPCVPRVESQVKHSIGNKMTLKGETRVLRISIGFAAAGLTFNGSATVWPTYLSKMHHSSVALIGSVAAVAMLFGIAGSAVLGVLISRNMPSRWLVMGIAAMAVTGSVMLYTGIGGFYSMALAMLIWNLATGATVAFIFAMLPRYVRSPRNGGAATGILYQLGCIGALLGAPVFLELATWNHSAFALCAVVIACFACMAALFPVWGPES